MDNAKLTNDLDLDFSLGYIPWATNNEAVKQHIRLRLNIFQGEWFLDSSVGTPYRQYILGCRDSKIATDALAKVIRDTPDVLSPILKQQYEFDRKKRTLYYSFVATTKFGNIDYRDLLSL